MLICPLDFYNSHPKNNKKTDDNDLFEGERLLAFNVVEIEWKLQCIEIYRRTISPFEWAWEEFCWNLSINYLMSINKLNFERRPIIIASLIDPRQAHARVKTL